MNEQRKKIWLASPHMSEAGYEQMYIQEAFDQNWITTLGRNVNEFEDALKAYTGGAHVVALSAGTAALHLALILAGVGPGDTVFCQDLTFSASANPIAYLGAKPVFIDSERETWNMDPAALERAFELYGRPKAVIVVDLYGTPAKWEEIEAICRRYEVPLIEDAAEALGSTYRGRQCGTFGRFGVLSFNGNKIITTSGGGALICASQEDADHALKLATQAREPVAWYEHQEVGYNYRLSNISAGIGRGQMHVLDERVGKKRSIYRTYQEKLADLPLTMAPIPEDCEANCWLSAVLLEEGQKIMPADIIAALAKEDIEARHVWKPMHMQPVFQDAAFVTAEKESVSAELFARGICLPSDTKMDQEDLERICKIIHSVF